MPTVTGGTAPVTTSCMPASGSSFTVGSTPVTCIATDAVRRASGCTFAVSVALPSPHLSVTRILAFGDSITEGEVPEPGEFLTVSASGLVRVREVMPDASYPADLTTMLAQRYTAQGATRVDAFTFIHSTPTSAEFNDCSHNVPVPTTSGIVVVNAGCLGAPALSSDSHPTLTRLMDKIGAYNPDLLLLHIGVNDLNSDFPATSIAQGLQGVQQLIAYARSRGIRVMVGTLLPQIAADLTHGGSPELIVPFNNQLRTVVANADATLVDLYTDINSNVTAWISPFDGLHPSAAGYQEIASVWFNAIKNSGLETTPSPVPTATTSSPVRLKPDATYRHF